MDNKEKEINLNILGHIEDLSRKVNEMMAYRTKSVFRRYPITFALLVLLGVLAVSEGLKGILKELGLLEYNPLYILIAGLIVLTFTGRLYKKLDKESE